MLNKTSKWVVMKTKQRGTKLCMSPGLLLSGELSVLSKGTQWLYCAMLPFRGHFATFASSPFSPAWAGMSVISFQRSVSSNLERPRSLCPSRLSLYREVREHVGTVLRNLIVLTPFHLWLLLPKADALSLGGHGAHKITYKVTHILFASENTDTHL